MPSDDVLAVLVKVTVSTLPPKYDRVSQVRRDSNDDFMAGGGIGDGKHEHCFDELKFPKMRVYSALQN